jgi:hypothetical protein
VVLAQLGRTLLPSISTTVHPRRHTPRAIAGVTRGAAFVMERT